MHHVQAAQYIESDFLSGSTITDQGDAAGISRQQVKEEKLAKAIEFSRVSSKKLYYV